VVALGDAGDEIGEFGGEIGVEQVRVERSRSVVEEPADHADAALAQHCETIVGPAEVASVRVLGRNLLPENRKADRADTYRLQQIEVGCAYAVARLLGLVAVIVANTDDRALGASPQFGQGCTGFG
jgi:hypothetical protein